MDEDTMKEEIARLRAENEKLARAKAMRVAKARGVVSPIPMPSGSVMGEVAKAVQAQVTGPGVVHNMGGGKWARVVGSTVVERGEYGVVPTVVKGKGPNVAKVERAKALACKPMLETVLGYKPMEFQRVEQLERQVKELKGIVEGLLTDVDEQTSRLDNLLQSQGERAA